MIKVSKFIIRSIAIAILAALLSACSSPLFPSPEIIERALTMQVQHTQTQLSQNLGIRDPLSWEIDRLDIRDREFLTIQNLPSFKLSGTYILTLRSPSRGIDRHRYSFQIYLQRQQEGKTWRLARRVGAPDDRHWSTDLIPPPTWIP